MEAWWAEMEWFERIFWIIAIPFSFFFLIQLLLSFIGADADTAADFEGDLDEGTGDGGGFQIFTIRNFVIFMTVFGWSGITFYNMGFGKGAILVISFSHSVTLRCELFSSAITAAVSAFTFPKSSSKFLKY